MKKVSHWEYWIVGAKSVTVIDVLNLNSLTS